MFIRSFAAVVAVAAAGSAVAADLPVRKSAPVMAVVSPMYNWTGFYAGVQGGWMGGAKDRVGYVRSNGYVHPNIGNLGVQGGFVGARAGYDWQAAGSPLVVGVVGDLNYDWAKRSMSYVWPNTSAIHGRSRADWDASLRLRAGYAFDRFLVYATGGVAFVHNKYTMWGVPYANGPVTATMSSSKVHTGGTIGVGVQYAVTNNMAVGLEYRYTRVQARTATGNFASGGTFWTRPTPDFHRIAATLDWKF